MSYSIIQSKSLNTLDIYKHLKADFFSRQSFLGVLPRDKLPKHVRYPSSIVINTHTSKQKGEHWLAVFYEKDGSSVFFDSFGHDPQFYGLENFLEKTCTSWTFNKQQLQSLFSPMCGYYCIFFILLKSRNWSFSNIIDLFSKIDFNINDFLIQHVTK